MISKNLIEAKKELQENHENISQSNNEKKKQKSPQRREMKNKIPQENKKFIRNKSSSAIRPSTSTLPKNNKPISNKKSENKMNKSLQNEDDEIIEFTHVGNIISTQNKAIKIKNAKYDEAVKEKTRIINQIKNEKLNKNDIYNGDLYENERDIIDDIDAFGNTENDGENYDEYEIESSKKMKIQEKESKNEFNDDILNKFDNLNSIEDSMKKLNQILEISTQNSIKNRYNYGLEKNESDELPIPTNKNKNNKIKID